MPTTKGADDRKETANNVDNEDDVPEIHESVELEKQSAARSAERSVEKSAEKSVGKSEGKAPSSSPTPKHESRLSQQ